MSVTIPQTVNKVALERAICKSSFFDFFLRFWPVLLQEKLVLNWHIRYVADELQKVAERVFRREPKEYDLIINVSPGSTKSLLASVMFPAWCWCRDPSLRTICASYGYDLAYDLADRCRRVLTSEKYQDLFPEVALDKEGVADIKTSKGGQRLASSCEGRLTGFHAHIQLIDDPINPKEALSEQVLKTTNQWFDETLASRMVDRRVTPLILIMQRLHQGDPTAHVLEKAGRGGKKVKHICLPAEIVDPAKPNVKPRSLRRFYTNGLFDPIRLPKDILTQAELSDLGSYGYAGQYLQTPIPPGGGMFQVDKMDVKETAPKFVKLVRSWDKAGSSPTKGNKGGCYTVGVLMGKTVDKEIWVLDVVRGQWEANQRERIIQQTARSDRATYGPGVLNVVEQEPGSGGKESAQATLRNLIGFRVVADRPTGDKIFRADPLSAQVNAGNVTLLAGSWNAAYKAELQFFPFSKYRDQVDASSQAFNWLTKGLVAGGLGGVPAGKPTGGVPDRDRGMTLAKSMIGGLRR